MQTDVIEAWQLEVGDWLTLGSDEAWKVSEVFDNGNTITVILDAGDGEEEHFGFLPDESLTIVVAFDDEEVEDF